MSESVEVSASAGAAGPSRPAWVLYAGGAFVAALVLIVGAGLLLRGGGEPGGAAGPEARPTYEPAPAPTWNATPLAGVTLPPLRGPQYPGEPTSYIMEDRMWDYVGPGWGLGVFGYNLQGVARDPNAFQGIYLISPEGYPFFLWKLRTDLWLSVEHWIPSEKKAWLSRCDGGEACQTIEFDIVPGEAIETWVVDGGAATSVNNAVYLWTLAQGSAVWEMSAGEGIYGVMTRAPGGPTGVLEALEPATGYDEGDLATQYWFDRDAGVAYLRTDTPVTEGDSFRFDSAWSTVDLSTGVASPLATVAKEPSDYVVFQTGYDVTSAMMAGRCRSLHLAIAGWLLENCSETAVASPDLPGTYLIDPTGVADPIPYTGAVPELRTSWTTATPADFGLPADAGWGTIIRALSLP